MKKAAQAPASLRLQLPDARPIPPTVGLMAAEHEHLELLDWRRRVSELFAEVRRRDSSRPSTLAWFRAQKDVLYQTHPQSPIPPPERKGFEGLSYWPHDPDARVVAHYRPERSPDARSEMPLDPGETALLGIGHLEFVYRGHECVLGAYWMQGYAGGLFVPFRDATSGRETYGGGRYALDTIKSADLGSDWKASTVVLDFNYAYHPSCTFSPRWVCPLAPPANTLPIPINAGERLTPLDG